jgi:phage terminase large subunit
MVKTAKGRHFEATRRIFGQCWFNEATTEAGLEALGFYHEKKDEQRDVGLGPSHNWSSHAADAFGLMAIAYEEPQVSAEPKGRPRRSAARGREAWLAS